MTVTRTLNPLHFEDLEPHRFEDLVRQLAYGFRPWRSIEATGRKGNDEGVDIRAIEIIAPASDIADDDSEDTPVPAGIDREWRIQVKRQKELGPADVRRIVADAIPEPETSPYGLIVAAACNISADALAAFREEAANRRVTEAHFWMNAHLEDMLFLPTNDHLLFAYFGISLRVRQSNQLTKVRAALAIKRKLRSAFGSDEPLTGSLHQAVVVRDITAAYPDPVVALAHAGDLVPPWHSGSVRLVGATGLVIDRFYFDALVRPNDTWDIREVTRSWESDSSSSYWDEVLPGHRAQGGFEGAYGNEPERKVVHESWLLSYENILEVDPFGDYMLDGTHLICRFDGIDGPYRPTRWYSFGYGRDEKFLDPDMRRPLFVELDAAAHSGGGQPEEPPADAGGS